MNLRAKNLAFLTCSWGLVSPSVTLADTTTLIKSTARFVVNPAMTVKIQLLTVCSAVGNSSHIYLITNAWTPVLQAILIHSQLSNAKSVKMNA